MESGPLLDRVRDRLRTPPSCGVPAADRLVADALVPGKLLRPDLVVRSAAAAVATGGAALSPEAAERIVAGALAVELLHVATLVHDDIIDAAPTRRGRLSVVAAAGTGTAIVVGDLLLARAAVAAAASSPLASAACARALERMAAGQLREAGLAAAPSVQAHAEYATLKTAELFRTCAEVGAAAVGADPAVLEAHGRFGLHFGVAFQHVDDLLDAVGDPVLMGKPVGADAANGVPTAVTLLDGSVEAVAGLVADELDAAREAVPALADWATAGLRRALGTALDLDGRRRTAGLAAALRTG
ncbi:polyprenyl synthetase family protein [Nocardioides litoris]|uniref:polyprenyl synthetase family protein n=1 Tax=Nocardioides litoris TaxID=1926648 RepID=UPI001477211C|nr:polyprenyl synthetase family protein [Nocardioides litoris]